MMPKSQIPHLNPQWIDPYALEIVEALQKNGFTTYLVGGCVRDLLLGIIPKDFDIVTEAKPNEVRRLISRAYIIGRRFRLVLVRRGETQFEVATFRRLGLPDEGSDDPHEQGDNFFGSPEEDSNRRDFTINGLFYDPINDQLIDYCGGLKDIENRLVRMIGDPKTRLKEDPIRILRGLRLAHKIHFSLEPELRCACGEFGPDLAQTALPRRREEILKWLRLEDPTLVFHEAFDLGLWTYLAPTLGTIFNSFAELKEFDSYLHRIHQHVANPYSPVELFAYLFLSFIRATLYPDPLMAIENKSFLEDPRVIKLFKEELGLFKYELFMISRAFQFQKILIKIEDFKKRGDRRRKAVIMDEAFPIALMIAQADYLLSPSQLFFWCEERTVCQPLIEQAKKRSYKSKRKKKRRISGIRIEERKK